MRAEAPSPARRRCGGAPAAGGGRAGGRAGGTAHPRTHRHPRTPPPFPHPTSPRPTPPSLPSRSSTLRTTASPLSQTRAPPPDPSAAARRSPSSDRGSATAAAAATRPPAALASAPARAAAAPTTRERHAALHDASASRRRRHRGGRAQRRRLHLRRHWIGQLFVHRRFDPRAHAEWHERGRRHPRRGRRPRPPGRRALPLPLGRRAPCRRVDAADGRVFCLAPPWPPAAAVPDGYLEDGIDYDPYEGGSAVADAGNYSRRLSTAVELSTNGVDFTASGLNFTYHAPPRLTALEPTVGPSAGDTDVVIHGDFGDAPAWACRVGDARPAAAELVDAPTRGAGARALRCLAAHRARGERVGRSAGDARQSQLRGARGGRVPKPKGRQQAEA